jgi:hypothetical protein
VPGAISSATRSCRQRAIRRLLMVIRSVTIHIIFCGSPHRVDRIIQGCQQSQQILRCITASYRQTGSLLDTIAKFIRMYIVLDQ